MIKVILYQNKKREYVGFQTTGHAGLSDSGQDIVCAAASVLIINTMNAIEMYTKDQFSQVSDDKQGVIDFQIKGAPSREVQLLLKTMVLGLEAIEDDENYEKYIDLTFEEV